MRALLVAVSALVLAAPAWAHTTLLLAEPGVQSRVEGTPPRRVALRFDQVVIAVPDGIRVWAADGRLVSGPVGVSGDGRVLEAAVSLPPRGAYTVRWRAPSADGHVAAGVFTFGVGVAAPPPLEAVGAGGPGTSDHAIRWAYFLSLALLLGPLAFRLLVVRGAAGRVFERRFWLLAGVGAVATVDVGIAAFVMRAEDALQLPFGDLLYGDLSPLANGTRFGAAFTAMTLGFALVAALLFLAWLSGAPPLLWAAFAVALAFASGLSLSGHSAVEANSTWATQLADWVHLVAASVWLGGVVTLVVCVWPAGSSVRRQAFLAFSRFATGLVAALVAAGIYLAIARLPELADLWEEAYGRVLLVKLGLVSVALAWGALHHFVVRPAVERGGGGGRVRRSLIGESTVGIAVLLVAAVLVNSAPPAPPAAAPPSTAASAGR